MTQSWTVHPVISHDDWEAYALLDENGIGFLIGERHEVQSAINALIAALDGILAEPIKEDDESLGTRWLSISEACHEAHAYDPDAYPLDSNLAYRIRQAARRGALTGAYQGPSNRWKFQARRFRHWLAKEKAHRPGPPLREL